MADSAAYPQAKGIAEQHYAQQQYSYQTQAAAAGGAAAAGQQYYSSASGIEHQQAQEGVEQQGSYNQAQEVGYAQYTQSGAELASGQQYGEQADQGIIQQYAGATGQLVQQQGQGGYKINFDPNPQIIRKHANDAVTYKQEVAVRYLRPPTPPPPGPLIIKEVRRTKLFLFNISFLRDKKK